ncbi:MAG TPA: hypothetical protein VFN29_04805 [Chiayiivirga sp.]|nr:hypothetical protein [Chiayiivirga sp.]
MTTNKEDPRIALTRKLLWDIPASPDGYLRMKHPESSRFGKFAIMDLVADRYVLQVKEEDGSVEFEDIEAVVDAGWLID